MAISQTIDADYKVAFKAKDQLTTSCLRLMRAALKNKEKDQGKELTEEQVLDVLTSLAKQRRDSIAQYTEGGRQDLADQEQAELEIIQGYLPEQLDEAGISQVLDQVFSELNPSGPKDMGLVMKQSMARLKGQADGKLVSKLVKKRLLG
jgi:uncharacterized protein YqeY